MKKNGDIISLLPNGVEGISIRRRHFKTKREAMEWRKKYKGTWVRYVIHKDAKQP